MNDSSKLENTTRYFIISKTFKLKFYFVRNLVECSTKRVQNNRIKPNWINLLHEKHEKSLIKSFDHLMRQYLKSQHLRLCLLHFARKSFFTNSLDQFSWHEFHTKIQFLHVHHLLTIMFPKKLLKQTEKTWISVQSFVTHF